MKRLKNAAQEWVGPILFGLGVIALVVAMAVAVGGCTMQLPGLRFAPGEETKQSSQVASDLAVVAATTGLPPGSAAARQMANTARATSAYTGPPSKPVDLADLLPQGVTGAWTTLKEQRQAQKLKADIRAKSAEKMTAWLAELAQSVEGKAQVAGDRIIYSLQALAQSAKFAEDVAAEVPVPADPNVSAAEQERLDKLDKAVAQLAETASAQATRRPTVGEVGAKVQKVAEDTADTVYDALEPWLPLLVGIPGVGGVLAGWQAVRKKRQAQAEVQAAKTETAAASAGAATLKDLANAALAQLAAAPPKTPEKTEEKS